VVATVKTPGYCHKRKPVVPKTERRIEKAMNGGHEMDWVRACKESADTRVKTKSDFSESGPFKRNGSHGCSCCQTTGP